MGINMLNKIKSNTYIMQIMTLMSGTLIAQIVMLAFMPILTRLYTPSEFGIYSLFFSIAGIFGMVSSLKYDQAIMLPKTDKDAQALVFLSVLIILGIISLITLGLFLFNDYFIHYFSGLVDVVWLLPVSILLTGLLQIFNAFSSRNQFYKKLATVRVANSLTIVGFQGLSRSLFRIDGLIIGKMFADLVSLFLLLRFHLKNQTLQLRSLSKRRLLANAKRHNHFPKYQSFTVFLNALSQSIPVLLFASLYSAEIAGFYALTVQMLQAPIGLIGGSTREVYYQRASKMFAAGENILGLYVKTTMGLLKIFIIPFVTIAIFGGYLFTFFFGNEWSHSGAMAQILILWFLFLFINPPSVITYSILKLQKVQMILEIVSILLRFFSIFAGFYFFNSYMVSIILFMISSVVVNIFVILFIYLKLKKGVVNAVFR